MGISVMRQECGCLYVNGWTYCKAHDPRPGHGPNCIVRISDRFPCDCAGWDHWVTHCTCCGELKAKHPTSGCGTV